MTPYIFPASCSDCRGLGWRAPKTARPDAWPEVCATCRGKTKVGITRAASILKIDRRDLHAVATNVAGTVRAERVFKAIAAHAPGWL
jgi:hypothetical protein